MTDVCSRNAPWCPPHSFSPVANASSLNFVSVVIKPANGFINFLSKIRSFSPLSEVSLSILMSFWIAHRSLPFSDSLSVVWRVSASPRINWIMGGVRPHWFGATSAANWRTRSRQTRLSYIRPPLKPSTSEKSPCRLVCSSSAMSASTLANWSWLTACPTNLMASNQGCWHRELRREWQQQLLTGWLTTAYGDALIQCMVRDFLHLLIFH